MVTRAGPGTSAEVEDYQFASARLEWARLALCLGLASQREPLEWHRACCDAAFAALTSDERAEVRRQAGLNCSQPDVPGLSPQERRSAG